jgi:hypothetical protein
VTLDPYSDTDSLAVPKKWGERNNRTLNLKFVIRNFFYFSNKNSIYDAFKIIENRTCTIRAQNFVGRVTITEQLIPQPDSVDVFIRVLDT